MRMKKIIVPAIVAVTLITACGPTVMVTKLGDVPGHPSPNVIKVYHEGDEIGRAYHEIATLSVHDKRWGLEASSLRTMIINEAQKIGAEGIIIKKMEEVGGGGLGLSTTLILPKRPKQVLTATAIIFD